MEKKLVEKINANALRDICIDCNWFTCGDNVTYEKFLSKYDGKKPTVERIEELATKILQNSNTDADILDIMSAIYSRGVIRFAGYKI